MTSLLIQNGRVIDPANGRDELADLLIQDGRVAAVGRGLTRAAAEVFDARGKVVAPGFVDLHVHLREPGFESDETIASGTRAAAAGGFTSVVPMANTNPVIDTAAGIKFIQERAGADAAVNVFPIAAVTREQKGESIVEFGDLVQAGAVAFSDDGHAIMNNEIMRRALEYCAMFDVPILDHCGDLNLIGHGVMCEGEVSTRLGLPGIPPVAEAIQVARDIALAEYVGGKVHIQHVSCALSVEFIKRGKERGVAVTAEVTPHHLALTDACLERYDSNFKMSPPLASEEERRALVRGLAEGVIDCIATDHAPHSATQKDKTFDEAPFGVIGSETAFPVVYTELVVGGALTLPQLIEKLSTAPARILKLPKGTLSIGADADVTILDTEWRGAIDESMFRSRSRNTPFLGRQVHGKVAATIVRGRVVYRDGQVLV
ncbi:MAG: dihydroorotase [Candidatus Sumerlaeota bacterium]|nr:dihydroorotase [Candidatus Sumerlaeota bacterium]